MSTTDRIVDTAGVLSTRAADALDNLDIPNAADRAARAAGRLAEETASSLRKAGRPEPARRKRRIGRALLVVALAAAGFAWFRSRGVLG